MKRVLVAILLTISAPLAAQAKIEAPLPGWLTGSWLMEDGARWADEYWTPPRGGMMIGASRMGFGPELETWETTRIMRGTRGGLSLFVQRRGEAVVEFPLAHVSAAAVEFANPLNGFPQRIRYERVGQLLIAEVSRMDGSDTMRWQYRPVAQEAP
ncbi:MAG: DUF6265 family protein [Novosphingobium sp.]